jgi:diguanylate cyclase (GGDEF)-like protein
MRTARPSLLAVVRTLKTNSRSDILIAAFALIAGATIIIGAILSILTTRTAAISSSEHNLQRLADILGDQVERSFLSVEASQKLVIDKLFEHGITTKERLQSISSDPVWHKKLASLVATNLSLDAIAIADNEGDISAASRIWPAPVTNVADRDYFKAIKEDPNSSEYVSAPILSRVDGLMTVYISRRLQAADGRFLGVVLAGMKLSDLEKFQQAVTIDADMSVAFYRRDGLLIARYPENDSLLGKNYYSQSTVLQGLGPDSQKRVFHQKSLYDGLQRIIAGRYLEKTPLIVSVTDTESDALAAWRQRTIEITVFVVVLTLAIAVTTFFAISRVRASEKASKKERYLARHDPLTGLANRILFREQFNLMIAQAKRERHGVGVVIVDLDRFKDVNDTLGHQFGDILLVEVAARLRGSSGGRTVARLGGDEFAIILHEVSDRAQLEATAAQLITVLSEPYTLGPHRVAVGASIGVSSYPDDALEPSKLLQCADMALYRAKADGRGAFCLYLSEMYAQVCARREIERELRQAVKEKTFEIAYQPIMSLEDDRIIGHEALLRWTKANGQIISPTEFIPVAEELGLIADLGRWVLEQACIYASSWDLPLRLAVNLSPTQFLLSDVASDVKFALELSGLPPERLELEITESVVLDEAGKAAATLKQLKALGVSIALDDFGTGYSSLSYLRRFPFDRIKIDRSFVREMMTSADDLAIIKATILLAAELGMQTTAEGVEEPEQLAALRQHGCSHAQGYLIGKPRRGGVRERSTADSAPEVIKFSPAA